MGGKNHKLSQWHKYWKYLPKTLKQLLYKNDTEKNLKIFLKPVKISAKEGYKGKAGKNVETKVTETYQDGLCLREEV